MDRGFAYGYVEDVKHALSSETNVTDTFVKSKGCVQQAATGTRRVSQGAGSGGDHVLEAATPAVELSVECHEQ